MKNLVKRLIDTLADAALLEEGVQPGLVRQLICRPREGSLEGDLVEIAFAEEADYDDIHGAILREHRAHCAAA